MSSDGAGERHRLRPFDRALVAGGELVEELDGILAIVEQPHDEGVAGGSGEVGVLLRSLRQVEAEVGLAVDAHAGEADRAIGERQRLERAPRSR